MITPAGHELSLVQMAGVVPPRCRAEATTFVLAECSISASLPDGAPPPIRNVRRPQRAAESA
jgi:hypothetical protein